MESYPLYKLAHDGLLHSADNNVIKRFERFNRPLFITYLFFFSLFRAIYQLHIRSVNLLPVVLEAGERLHVVLRKLPSVT